MLCSLFPWFNLEPVFYQWDTDQRGKHDLVQIPGFNNRTASFGGLVELPVRGASPNFAYIIWDKVNRHADAFVPKSSEEQGKRKELDHWGCW
jgi:hypothetical protein